MQTDVEKLSPCHSPLVSVTAWPGQSRRPQAWGKEWEGCRAAVCIGVTRHHCLGPSLV